MTLAAIIRSNLQLLLELAKRGTISGPATPYEIEAQTGVGKSTVYRILDAAGDNRTRIVVLEKLANAYGLQAWQLLIPQLDPLHPPKIYTPQEREQIEIWHAVYEQVQRLAGVGTDANHSRETGAGKDHPRDGPHSGSEPPQKRDKYPRP